MAGRRSVGSEAAARALRSMTAAEAQVVVVGCGKVGAHAARSLAAHGVGDLVLLNRTPARAEELAGELGATTAPWEDRASLVARADAVIVATGAEEPVLHLDRVAEARARLGLAEPVLILDLAMPRNVAEGSDGTGRWVTLIDLDQLEPETASAERARLAAVPEAERLVEREVGAFFAWLAGEPAREALRPLREALADICLKEIEYASDPATAERTAGRIVAKLLAGPMTRLQEACVDGRSVDQVALAVSQMFAVTPSNPESMHHATR
jgi:glutamyl-tRNA reductase